MTAQAVRVPVALSTGETDVSGLWTEAPGSDATIVLAHGAGAGMTHPFLEGLAGRLAGDGFSVLRFVFPYVEAGRRMPGPAAHAVATWAGVQRWLQARGVTAFVAAGKSYGGRMASVATADGALAPRALVYLGYPLHPPGRPDKPRAEHLPAITVPQYFIEGENDPFIAPREQFDEVVATCRDARVHWVEGANHSFEVKGMRQPAEQIGAGLAGVVGEFVRGLERD